MKTLAVLVLVALAGCVKPPAEKCADGVLWVRNDYGIWVPVDSTPFTKQFTPTQCRDDK